VLAADTRRMMMMRRRRSRNLAEWFGKPCSVQTAGKSDMTGSALADGKILSDSGDTKSTHML
jgi:hypothetical protein